MSQAEQPTYRTSKLLLRPFLDADLENVYKGLSNPEVIRYYGVSYATMEETLTQMRFFEDLIKSKTGMWWAICDGPTGEFLGAIGYNNADIVHQKAEIGFWLLQEHWGRGIIPEAMPIVIRHAFSIEGLQRLEAVVESENEASKKTLLKMGFAHEATLREAELKNDIRINLDIFSILKNP